MFFNIIIFFIILGFLILLFNIPEGFIVNPATPINLNLVLSGLNTNPTIASNIEKALSTDTLSLQQSGNSVITVVNNKMPTIKNKENFENEVMSFDPLKEQIRKCELATDTCSAFDNADFAANCGVSFDINGKNNDDKPHVGGLYINTEDRAKQLKSFDSNKSYNIFQPTTGTASAGTFAIRKEDCAVIKETIDCKAKQSFDVPNCKQCYNSAGVGDFLRIGPTADRPTVDKLPYTLYLYGNGKVSITTTTKTYKEEKVNKNGVLNPTTAFTFYIPSDAEGSIFSIMIQPNEPNESNTYVAGYLEGTTPNNKTQLDMSEFINTINKIKKYRISETIDINKFNALKLIPAQNEKNITFDFIIPFTFFDENSCNGPAISMESSANFLNSSPCFGGKNKIGDYTLECLQDRWLSIGGTSKGTGYPYSKDVAEAQQKADALQKPNGNPININTITNNLSIKMKQALLGSKDGTPLSINEWNDVSMMMTGKPINTPCDVDGMSKECLSYLYNNEGANSHIGSTYKLSQFAGKNSDGDNIYCLPGTSIDPNTPAGTAFAKKLTGIEVVKNAYNDIHKLANTDTPVDDARAIALKQCYDIDIQRIPPPNGVFIATGNVMLNNSKLDNGFQIFYANQNLTGSDMKWTQMNGLCSNISLAPNGNIFCTNMQSAIFYKNNYKDDNWRQLSGELKQIHTDGINVVGANYINDVYSTTIANIVGGGSWTKMPAQLKMVVTMNNSAYGIGLDDRIWYLPYIYQRTRNYWFYAYNRWHSWQLLINGTFINMSIDNYVMLLLGMDKKIYYSEYPFGSYTIVPNQPTTFKSISISMGTIYAIDIQGNPWYSSNYKKTTFLQITNFPGGNQQVASHRILK